MKNDKWNVAAAIKTARERTGSSIRELGRRSGISAAQLSRIEAGEVDRPSAETLVAVARALDANPMLLMILSGHVGADEARERLSDLLAEGTEMLEEWMMNPSDVEDARTALNDPEASDEALREIAWYAFLTESGETLWDDSYLVLGSKGPKVFRDISQLWPHINEERQALCLQFLRDQAELSRMEFQREMQADVGPLTANQDGGSNGTN